MSTDLHLLLAGPFVFWDVKGKDCFRILIPDLMDTHYKPGFTATHNSAELDNGEFRLSLGGWTAPDWPVQIHPGSDFDFDRPPCGSMPANTGAYAVLELPRPNCLFAMSPADGEITSPGNQIKSKSYATRATLVYESVDLSKLTLNPPLLWHGMGDKQPAVEVIGSVGLLVLDMRPIEPPTDEEHAMMAYRNMARMVGVDRYMRQFSTVSGAPITRSEINMLKGKYNDCGAALMLVSTEDSASRDGKSRR
jgi:hypothetical protein